jgi:hypothetical protein
MRDRDIRSAVHRALWAEHRGDETTLIVDELGLCQGAVRADVAVINGSLAGFEIKSDRDTLQRLPRQIEVYGRVFDYVTLVVGKKHARAVKRSIPRCWGLAVASGSDASVTLETERPARRNTKTDPLSVARLLWREETLVLLRSRGLDAGLRSKPRRHLWEALVRELAADDLSAEVRRLLRARAGWRAVRPQSRCGDSSQPASTS